MEWRTQNKHHLNSSLTALRPALLNKLNLIHVNIMVGSAYVLENNMRGHVIPSLNRAHLGKLKTR